MTNGLDEPMMACRPALPSRSLEVSWLDVKPKLPYTYAGLDVPDNVTQRHRDNMAAEEVRAALHTAAEEARASALRDAAKLQGQGGGKGEGWKQGGGGKGWKARHHARQHHRLLLDLVDVGGVRGRRPDPDPGQQAHWAQRYGEVLAEDDLAAWDHLRT